MTLETSIWQVERALSDLRKVAGSTEGWSDQQRRDFDRERVGRLDRTAGHLLRALQQAQQQCVQAERLLASRD